VPFLTAINQAVALAQANDWAGERQILEGVSKAGYFSGLPEAAKHAVWQMQMEADLRLDDPAAALDHARLATASTAAVANDWRIRLLAAYWTNDADQFSTLGAVARRFPELLPDLKDEVVVDVLDRAETAESATGNKDLYFSLLDTLFDAKWKPDPLQASA